MAPRFLEETVGYPRQEKASQKSETRRTRKEEKEEKKCHIFTIDISWPSGEIHDDGSTVRIQVAGHEKEGTRIRADVNRQKSFRSQYVLHRVGSLLPGKATLQRAIRTCRFDFRFRTLIGPRSLAPRRSVQSPIWF